MEHTSWITGALVYLAAAVLAVPLARFFGLGSIIGYLGAGILIGVPVLIATRPMRWYGCASWCVIWAVRIVQV